MSTLLETQKSRGSHFAKWVFIFAGLYGIVILAPQYFLEKRIGEDQPPPISHPEYFYGFIGVALTWQMVFLIIGSNPVRFRPLMPIAILEKLSFGLPSSVLFAGGRLASLPFTFAMFDLVLALLFARAFIRTSNGRDFAQEPSR